MPILVNIIVLLCILYFFVRYMQSRQQPQRQREEELRQAFHHHTGIWIPRHELRDEESFAEYRRLLARFDATEARTLSCLESSKALLAFIQEEDRHGR